MADTATTTGTVKLEGNSDKLVISYKKAEAASNSLNIALTRTGQAWDVQAKAAKRAELANEIASARMENAKQRAADLDRVFGKAGQSADKAGAGIGRLAGAVTHGQGPMRAFGSAVHGVSTGQQTMIGGINMILSAFGPWGIVIGAAAAGLGHFAHSQYEAAKATEEARNKIREEVAALKDLSKQERLTALVKAERESRETNFFGAATDEAEVAKEKAIRIRREMSELDKQEGRRKALDASDRAFRDGLELKTRGRVMELEVELFELEKAKVIFKNEGVNTKALEVEHLKKQAEIAGELGNADEKTQLLRQAELRELEAINVHEKRRTKEKKEQFHWSAELTNQMRMARAASGMQRDGSDSRDFAAGLEQSRLSGLARGSGSANLIAGAEDATQSRLRAVEAERASQRQFNHDAEIARINEEEAALLQLNEVKSSLAMTGAERDALAEEREQIQHEARMSRIETEAKAEEERMKVVKTGIDFGKSATKTVIGGLVSVGDARRQATMAARLQGKTEAEAARAGKIAELDARAAQMKGIRDMAIVKSIDHAFEAVGAFARYDFVSGGLHLAASAGFAGLAGIAGARANSLGDQSFHKQMGAQGGGAPGGGSGSNSQQPRSAPAPIDSDIPGSPTPKPQNRSAGAQRGTTIIQIDRVYGKVDRDFVAQVDEGLKDLSYDKRRKSA